MHILNNVAPNLQLLKITGADSLVFGWLMTIMEANLEDRAIRIGRIEVYFDPSYAQSDLDNFHNNEIRQSVWRTMARWDYDIAFFRDEDQFSEGGEGVF